MVTIGLIVNEGVITEKGLLKNLFIRFYFIKDIKSSNEFNNLNVAFNLYESRENFFIGNSPLKALNINKCRNIKIPISAKISETSIHKALKTVLESENLTITEVTL